jgi:hypothetical protein
MEVGVLLHVEINELGDTAAVSSGERRVQGPAVEPPEALREDREHIVPGQELDLGGNRRDLDGNALDVRSSKRLEVAREASLGLPLSQDGLAELVQVGANIVRGATRQVSTQRGVLAGQNHPPHLSPNPS